MRPAAGIEIVQGDIREPATVRDALDAVDWVVHAAAWHGIHLRDRSSQDFWSLNVEATFRLYETAAQAGVRGVVFSSTMGVYGESRRPAEGSGAVFVTEDLSLLPNDVYGLSKVLGEEMGAYYDRAGGVQGLALRFGMFVPEPFLRYGIRLLYGGVDERDVGSAVVAGLRRLELGRGPFTAYNIECALPFREEDAVELRTDPMAVISRYWPDAPELLVREGAELWGPINEVFDSLKARRELRWQPLYNFDQFVEALRSGHANVRLQEWAR